MWRLAHNIGTEIHPNYNTIQQIADCSDPIGFDGIYKNVYEHRSLLKDKAGIFFVMGNYVGKDNTFDLPNVPKLEQYCTWDDLSVMIQQLPRFEIGWHTWSHPDLTTLTKDEIMKEITPPFPMRTFAYPYGRFNDLVIQCVKEAGYQEAYSVTQGSTNPFEENYPFKIYRDYIR